MVFRACGARLIAVLLAVCLLLPSAASAQEQQITDIVIVGNERISNEAILAVIALKPGMPFSERAVQEAKQAIQAMGYFETTIVGTESVDAGIRVVFTVVENPVVKEIKVTGNTVMETEKLLSLLRTSVGGPLNMNTLNQQDVPAVERYYAEQGYIAYVTEEVGIDPQTGVLTIPILEVRVQEIRVTGNRKTKDFVILREMGLKSGDVFNRVTLSRDLIRIYDLEIFDREAAEPYRLEAGSDLGKVIITIPVKERKTGEISIGVGYSSRQRLVGQAKVSEGNFRGRAQTVSALWEQSGFRGSSFELGFFEPWLDSRHTSLGVNIYNKLIFRFASSAFATSGSADSDYDERRKGGSLTLSRPFSKASRGYVTLRSESVDTNIEDSELLGGGTDQQLLLPIMENGTITSGTFRFTNSSRDSEVDPFTGVYTSHAVEIGNADYRSAGDGEQVKSVFSKYSTDLRRYFSKGGPRQAVDERRRVVATRLLAGSLSGKVPFFEQYFVGGAETLRGFREDRFWGRNMFLASVEYRFPLAPSLVGVGFVDYGDAWGAPEQFRRRTVPLLDADGQPVTDAGGNAVTVTRDLLEAYPQHEGFSPSLGYGIGIRVRTPIGPLRLDYGFSKDGSRAHFSIGHVF